MTGAVTALLVCVGGGLGAALRFTLDTVLRPRTSDRYPVATTLVNVTGSFLLGLLTGLAARHAVSDAALLVLGAGVLGGYTTFSTASVETVRLLEDRRYVAGFAHGFGTLVASTAAAALGYVASALG